MLKRIFSKNHPNADDGSSRRFAALPESDEFTELYGCIETNNWDRSLAILHSNKPAQGVSGTSSALDFTAATTWYVKRHTNGTIWWKLLPLHNACRRNAPPMVIKALLRAYPESIAIADTHGMLPLHWALWGRASVDLVHVLIEADNGSAAYKVDEYGRLPMHLACEYSVSSASVVDLLSSVNPSATFVKDHRGKIPLALVDFDNRENRTFFKEMKKQVKAIRGRKCSSRNEGENSKPYTKNLDLFPLDQRSSFNSHRITSSANNDWQSKLMDPKSAQHLIDDIQSNMVNMNLGDGIIEEQQFSRHQMSTHKNKRQPTTFGPFTNSSNANSSSYFDGKPRLALTMTSCSASTTTHQNDYDPEPMRSSSRQKRSPAVFNNVSLEPIPQESMPNKGLSLDAYLDGYLTAKSRMKAPSDRKYPESFSNSDRSSVSSLTKEEYSSDF